MGAHGDPWAPIQRSNRDAEPAERAELVILKTRSETVERAQRAGLIILEKAVPADEAQRAELVIVKTWGVSGGRSPTSATRGWLQK